MCKTCGCGDPSGKYHHHHHHDHGDGHGHDHAHAHDPGQSHDDAHAHDHSHEHGHDHEHEHDHHGQTRTIDVGAAVLDENDRLAVENRLFLDSRGVVAVNLISSPGSGKTSLLEALLPRLKERVPVSVLEGDCQTSFDAERVAATGVPVHQITTGGACHLDAHMVAHGLDHVALSRGGLVIIENVGNLVCPADFALGERETIVLLSVTEGDDKPAKYPAAFDRATTLILTKMDLQPHVRFDTERAVRFALMVNPRLRIFKTSAVTGQGVEELCAWLAGLVVTA